MIFGYFKVFSNFIVIIIITRIIIAVVNNFISTSINLVYSFSCFINIIVVVVCIDVIVDIEEDIQFVNFKEDFNN